MSDSAATFCECPSETPARDVGDGSAWCDECDRPVRSAAQGQLVLVCGSRDWNDPDAIEDRLNALPHGVRLIVGGAKGADSMAERWGYSNLRSGRCGGVTVARANWHLHGKRAGIVRNLHMLDQEPYLVLAFWNGDSKGTAHTITEARVRGIPMEVTFAE